MSPLPTPRIHHCFTAWALIGLCKTCCIVEVCLFEPRQICNFTPGNSGFHTGKQSAHPFCSKVHKFRWLAVKSFVVCQFDASEGTLFYTSITVNLRLQCAGLCVRWAEVLMTCTVLWPTAVLKPGNSWSQQSVHHFIRRHEDEQLDSRWDKLKSPTKNPVLNSSGVQCKALILRPTSCFTWRYMFTPTPVAAFWKRRNITPPF